MFIGSNAKIPPSVCLQLEFKLVLSPFLKRKPEQLCGQSFIPMPEFCNNAVQACHHFQNTHRGSPLLGLEMEQKTGLRI